MEAALALYSTILCAIDFSEHSRRALRLALALASRQGSRVVAAHVVDPLLAEAAAAMPGAAMISEEAAAELRALMDEELARVTGPAPALTSVVRVGLPAREILASARDSGAGLVVMGTQGLGGLRKLFFGSIADKVLREADLPVLAVPAPDEGGTSLPPDIDLVIAAVELDYSAEQVAGHAASFAAGFGLPLTLLHVVPPVDGVPRAAAAARAAERRHEASAQARLAGLASQLPPGLEVSVEVRCGTAADEIAAAAASRQALVTIASGGDRSRHRPGSIAYRVLCLSESPVLAVPVRARTELR